MDVPSDLAWIDVAKPYIQVENQSPTLITGTGKKKKKKKKKKKISPSPVRPNNLVRISEKELEASVLPDKKLQSEFSMNQKEFDEGLLTDCRIPPDPVPVQFGL